MLIKPTKSGGREVSVKCSTLALALNIDAHAAGEVFLTDATGKQVGRGMVETLYPLIQIQSQALINDRKLICMRCEYNDGLTLTTVKCHGCGCAGLSLIHGLCPQGRWPEKNKDHTK